MIQLLLEVGVRYACAEEELTNRVAGLYLLYSVYFTQPCSPRVLIRLTLEYWTAMQQLHAELRSNKVRIHVVLLLRRRKRVCVHCMYVCVYYKFNLQKHIFTYVMFEWLKL